MYNWVFSFGRSITIILETLLFSKKLLSEVPDPILSSLISELVSVDLAKIALDECSRIINECRKKGQFSLLHESMHVEMNSFIPVQMNEILWLQISYMNYQCRLLLY